MKRVLLLSLIVLTIAFQAQSQVPRTVLAEMGSATW